jgi:hypothetical protein
MIDECCKEAINVVICENCLLKILLKLERIVAKLLMIMRRFTLNRTYELLVKQSQVSRCKNRVSLLVTRWQ